MNEHTEQNSIPVAWGVVNYAVCVMALLRTILLILKWQRDHETKLHSNEENTHRNMKWYLNKSLHIIFMLPHINASSPIS